MSHKKHRINFGKIVNGVGKSVVKPVWKQTTKTLNAPTQLAGELVHSAGGLGLPMIVLGGVALVIFLKMK